MDDPLTTMADIEGDGLSTTKADREASLGFGDDLSAQADDPGTYGAGATAEGDDDAEGSTLALFEGDAGGLSLEQRRALVCLMKNRFVSAAGNPVEWPVIRDDWRLLKSRLNDMFLDLHLERQYEVAYKRKAVADGSAEFPTLLHDAPYTREETILLVFLRHRFRSDQMAGHEDVTIERDELVSHVATFRPAHATDRSRDEQRVNKAVDTLISARVLAKTNDAARLRISPVIAVLLPLPRLHELHEWLIGKNGSQESTDETGGADDADMIDAEATA
jgi:hypothetical protein